MDVKEANVFHLDDNGQAFEFWGVAENQGGDQPLLDGLTDGAGAR